MTSGRFTVRARAARDLEKHVTWLRANAEDGVAERMLLAAAASFQAVARSPKLGAPAQSKLKELSDARKWRVEDYPNYLIFYAPRSGGGVTILRVLHAAQDWRR